jgi:DNA-binding NarL/FixJ family response regulator
VTLPSSLPSCTRIFVLGEEELVRRGVRSLLEDDRGLEVVGEATTAAEARVRIPVLRPEVVVLDVRLPDGDALELCRELRSTSPEVACLLLTSAAPEDALYDAVLAGAAGYVPQQVRGRELLEAVHTVARGESLLARNVTLRTLERLRQDPPAEDPLAVLTQQERRILVLIGAGRTNREIGQQLHLSVKTVKNYVTSMLAKLGMSRRTQAAAYVARLEAHAGHQD